jgi:D-arabinose 1-dehydrogenase-like Zn-dependent alcohol dehydrogenase
LEAAKAELAQVKTDLELSKKNLIDATALFNSKESKLTNALYDEFMKRGVVLPNDRETVCKNLVNSFDTVIKEIGIKHPFLKTASVLANGGEIKSAGSMDSQSIQQKISMLVNEALEKGNNGSKKMSYTEAFCKVKTSKEGQGLFALLKQPTQGASSPA